MMSNRKSWLAIAVPLCMSFEGMDLVAKHQWFDPPGVITYCSGLTNLDNPSVRAGDRFTKAQCEKFVVPSLKKYNAQMHTCIRAEQPPHREAALTDATYNLGRGNICGKRGRRTASVADLINAGQIAQACAKLKEYIRSNGRVLPGLVKRREVEYELCLRND